jgi:hypothetical protein
MIGAARLLVGWALLASAGAAADPPVTGADFVGCRGDGQAGPRPAPRTGDAPAIMASLSDRLVYYSAGNEGVLAPRGWHCIELSGSNGSMLIVTPERLNARRLLHRSAPLEGPAVVLVIRYGDTSGRREVAALVLRMFPQHQALLRRLEEGGVDLSELPSGPYADDIIGGTTDTWVEFTTPAGRRGLGTDGMLGVSAAPVEGLVMLLPEDAMLELNVRLPSDHANLAPWIISGVRHANGDNSR